MKKRIFSLFLVIAMLVTVLPVNVFAAGCDHEALDYSHYSGSQHWAWCDSCRQYIYGTCDKNGFAPDPWGDGHYQACSVCGYYSSWSSTRLDHTYGSVTTGSDSWGDYHSATCTACGYSTGKQYCSSSTETKYNDEVHWDECTVCGTKGAETAHSKTYTANGIKANHKVSCSDYDCDWSVTEECTLGETTRKDDSNHQRYCSLCRSYAVYEHSFGSWEQVTHSIYGAAHQRTCGECNTTVLKRCLDYAVAKFDSSTNQCWKECSVCGQMLTEKKTHTVSYWYGSNGSTSHSGTCSNCGGTVTESCSYDSDYSDYGETSKDGHRKYCSKCRTYSAYADHANLTYDYNGNYITDWHEVTCGVCAYSWDEECDLSYTYTDEEHTAKCKKCKHEETDDHTIDLTAEATSANVITVSEACTSNCGYADVCGTLTVTASDTTYDGTEKPAAVANTVNTGSSYEDGYSIFYYKQSGSGWSMLGSSAPKDAGTYKAEISSNVDYTEKASVTYKIAPADLDNFVTVTAQNTEFTYNRYNYTTKDYQTVYHSIKLNVTDTLPYYQNAKVEYSEDDGATWSSTNPAFTDVGTHTVKYRISAGDNFDTIEGSATVTIKPADLPIDGLAGYEGPFDGNWHYSFGYRVDGEYGFNYVYYFGTPWNGWYGDDFTFTFEWTDENGVAKTTSFNTANDTWEDAGNWPHYKKQNVSDYDEAGHVVNVTIVDNDGNYNTWSGSYSVKIGPAVGPTCSDVEAVYDAKPHHLTLMFGIDMDAYECIEYQVQDENGQWTGEWTHRVPDGISSEPSPYEPAYTDVGEYPVKWRVKIDSDMDGKIGGYNANGKEEAGGAYNSLGSLEIIAPRYGYNTIKITPATLTVTPNDVSVTYGDDGSGIVGNGYTVEGFQGSDNFNLDETNIAYTSPDYQQFDDVGTERTVEVSGLKMPEGNENYKITYAAGKLNILPKEIGIDWSNLVLVYNGSAQAPTATATGVVNNDVIALTVEGAQTLVGEGYVATVTGITGEKAGNYKLPADCDEIFKIVKAAAEAPDVTPKHETIRGKNDGGIVGLTTEMEYSADGGETWTKVTDPAVELAPGTYQVRYAETDASLPSEAAEVTINPGEYLTVTLPNGEGYTTSSDEADTADKQVYNDTFNFTVDIKEGYSKGENFKVTANGEELTPNEDGSYTITGIVEDVEVKVEGVVDNTAPTGTITVSTHKWKEFVKNITFNIFFKNSQTVTITAEDTGSGIKSIEYIACEAVLTEEYVKAIVASEWKPYTAPFAIDPDAKVVVYAKITDKAGNVKFISSDGMVFDGTAPVFNGVQDGGEYNEETKFTVTDDNLDKVTVDGVEVQPDENGNYTLPMDNKEHVLVATDKAGNETKITVNMKEKTAAPVVKPPVPSTGDDGLFLPLMLFMLSGIACVSLIVFKKKFRF